MYDLRVSSFSALIEGVPDLCVVTFDLLSSGKGGVPKGDDTTDGGETAA